MKTIGITGQNGFIGYHLYQTLILFKNDYRVIHFDRSFFSDEAALDSFVSQCDVIVHLAALNRHKEPEFIYSTNISLVNSLVDSLKRTESKAHVIISSSTQEDKDNLYGKSKKDGRLILSDWAENNTGKFTGLIIPNVFGPFCLPYYNSVVATFCHQLTHDATPSINIDSEINLIYVGELIEKIIDVINNSICDTSFFVEHTKKIRVSGLLELLLDFKSLYFDRAIIPAFSDSFELNLFNTFRSYFDFDTAYPKIYKSNLDERGGFTELVKLNSGGQVSFSTTLPGVTRGNHFHRRKIERFSVIKGEALIEIRRVGTNKVFSYKLSGNNPSYVDMPVWYTHNIKNIGDEDLYTIFWINESYNPEDTDTFFLTV